MADACEIGKLVLHWYDLWECGECLGVILINLASCMRLNRSGPNSAGKFVVHGRDSCSWRGTSAYIFLKNSGPVYTGKRISKTRITGTHLCMKLCSACRWQ
jgi:hypothetical protein